MVRLSQCFRAKIAAEMLKAESGPDKRQDSGPRLLEEGKEPLPMLAEPFGAVSSLIQGRIVEVPCSLFGRERLSGDHRPPPDRAPRRRIALFGEGRSRQKGEGGAEADHCNGFEHWVFSHGVSGSLERRDRSRNAQPPLGYRTHQNDRCDMHDKLWTAAPLFKRAERKVNQAQRL
jgi:hypothetical protein